MSRSTSLLLLFTILSVVAYDEGLRTAPSFVDETKFPTDHWALELRPGTNVQDIAAKHGHAFIRHLHGNIYLFEKKRDTIHGETHPHHQESEEIVWFQQQVARQLAKREEPSEFHDPLYSSQWHLHGAENEPNINAEDAWEAGITGEGVTIAIVDDGLEYTHPDLQQNYRADTSYDFNYGDPDPFPDTSRDDHGTSAGGVAAARDNAICGVGSAYRAKLSGIRLISKASTDVQESLAISYMYNDNHIYSNSWGPIDDGKRKEGPGPLATIKLEDSIQNGRHGKGSIYVWAAGNGRRSRDNCNYDGWANSRYTISIAAIDFSGEQAWYSESCSMLVVTAPSSGWGSKSIVTTDLLGSRGTSRDDCTTTFGGTSAAAPLAAGVVALILQANPNLGWRDVQGVLIESAGKHRDTDISWATNGDGYRYSHNFGFGVIDSHRAIEVARVWKNFPAEEKKISSKTQPNLEFGDATWHDTVINITESIQIEHVDVFFKANCQRRGDLEIRLVSPAGMVSNLAEQHGDVAANYDWRFGTIACWGEDSFGPWKLVVRDTKVGGTGVVTEFGLNIYGHPFEVESTV